MKPKEIMRVGKPAAPATIEAGAFVPAEKWLEHLEEEIEPRCLIAEKDDLELVLKNSPEDLAVRESLKRVRAAVKSLDEVALPESGHYYDNLHLKIMAAIDDDVAMNGEPIRQPAKARAPLFTRRLFTQPIFGLAGMTMMVAILAFVGLNRATSRAASSAVTTAAAEASIDENFERKIASLDSHVGAAFAHEMGSFESEEDFLTESAAQRLKQLSSAQADALIHTLSR
jgi:hypothetical protein